MNKNILTRLGIGVTLVGSTLCVMGKITEKKMYRYTINRGDVGGIVFATSVDVAKKMLLSKYKHLCGSTVGEILVWSWSKDDYRDKAFPDIIDCYGEK